MLVDVDAAVHGKHLEFPAIMLQRIYDFCDLYSEFSRRRQYQRLHLARPEHFVRAQVLDERETEGNSFPRARQIPHDQVLPIVYFIECLVLHGEEFFDFLTFQLLNCPRCYLRELGKITRICCLYGLFEYFGVG